MLLISIQPPKTTAAPHTMASNILSEVVDYAIFGLILLFSALVGIYFHFTGNPLKTTREFLLGNENIPVIPVGFSMMTSYWSAIGVLGFSSESYLYGFVYVYQIMGHAVTTPFIIYVYNIVFYNLDLSTVNEYLRRRFGKYASGAAALSFMIQIILYLPMVLYAPALTFNTVSGISLWASVSSVGLVCTFYSAMGGIKAVIWNDFFEVFLMFTTPLIVIVKGCVDLGGFGEVWATATAGGRINSPSFKFDLTERYGFWVLLIGTAFFSLGLHGINQIQVQRMMSVKSLKKSRQVIFVMQLTMILFVIVLCLCGIVIYANVGSCDPLLRSTETGIYAQDQLLPYYIMQSLRMYPGVPGLCISGIFVASMGTISSGLNSLAVVTLEDFIKPYCCIGRLTESKAVLAGKILVASYGLICVLLSYLALQLDGLFQISIAVFSALGTPVLGVFTLGMWFIRPNEKGAVVGLIVSSVLFCWIGISNAFAKFNAGRLPQTVEGCSSISSLASNVTFLNVTPTSASNEEGDVFPLYKIAYFWYSVFSFLLTILLGYLVSMLTGPNMNVDEELLTPFARWLNGCSATKREETGERDGF